MPTATPAEAPAAPDRQWRRPHATAPHVTGVLSGDQLSAPRIRRRGPDPVDAGRGTDVQGPAVASSEAAVGDLLGYGDLPELLAIRGEHLDPGEGRRPQVRSEEHTSELQSRGHLVCRLLLEKKKKRTSAVTCARKTTNERECNESE